MIRPILEFLLERSLIEGREPPRWLRWLAAKDAKLRSHAQQVRELDVLLRSAALSQRQQLAAGTATIAPRVARQRHAQHPRPAVRIAWIGAAAALLVASMVSFDRYREQQTKAEHVRLVTRGLTAVPNEMLSLFSQVAQVPQVFSPLERVKLPAVDPWSDIPRGAQGQLKKSFDDWGSQLTDMGEQVYERLMIVKL